jgi:glycosyltransferase involved in cell wall biosynthesis
MVNERHDWPLLREVARRRPEWQFVLIGHVTLPPAERGALAAYPNIHLLGVRPYRDLPAHLAACDACFQFYSEDKSNTTGDGQKLYLYLACGKPVVSTRPAIASAIREHVAVVSTPHEMIKAFDRILSGQANTSVHARRAAARDADWEVRVDAILAELFARGIMNSGRE